MKSMRFLCLLAATLAVDVTNSAQTPMQKGVNVRLANTESALDIAAADEPKALIISVTGDGGTYLGVNPISPGALTSELTRRGHAQKLFVKADASALYSSLEGALNAARTAGFSDCIFLTAQYEMPAGARILPKGIEVSLKLTVKAKTPRVELIKAAEETPALKINQRSVPWASLQNTLTTILGNQIERKVLIKAEGAVLVEHVVHAVDVANSIGAEIMLAPES